MEVKDGFKAHLACSWGTAITVNLHLDSTKIDLGIIFLVPAAILEGIWVVSLFFLVVEIGIHQHTFFQAMVFHSMIRTFGTCFEDMFVWRGVPQSEVFLTKDRPHLVVAVAWCLGDMADLVPHWTDHHPHALLQVVSWLHPANLSSLGKVLLHTFLFLHLYKQSKST